MEDLIAHVRQINDAFEIQTVTEHAVGTAVLSERFASAFGAAGWGRIVGLWHDVGKCTADGFQPYIRYRSGMTVTPVKGDKPDHTSAGAILAKRRLPGLYPPLSYCIAGHHAGLLDWTSSGEANMLKRLEKEDCYQAMLKNTPDEILNVNPVLEQPIVKNDVQEYHLWIRMLFSCLVDADYLDTERFMQPEHTALRGRYKSISELKDELDLYMEQLSAGAAPSVINEKRTAILLQCRKSGLECPGFYSLTVPTGGGKTLASMAWALEHAVKYKKERIIVVIPYTSIIVQTAAVFRKIFGDENVIEHHSNLQPDDMTHTSRLAIENWDAPIIVTTDVQFFESLYACKTSKCRKLHNICNSVVILDEAQMLPVEFLKPVLHILQGLQSSFKTSILFTTATQPVFSGKIGHGESTFMGLETPVTDIIPDSESLFSAFKRVEIHWPDSLCSFDEIADELQQYNQVLCIVNTRKEAYELYKRMPQGTTLHLSRMMCSAHIMDVIKLIKQKLADNEPVRVVSTQLVEAGVDIDFPVVYRAFAGLDSVVQAAGRCNREGKLNKKGLLGKVVVFNLDQKPLRGLMGKGADTLKELLKLSDEQDLLQPACMKRYFTTFYKKANTFDKANIKSLLYEDYRQMHFSFATAAANFRLIDDKDSVSVLVPYGDGATLIQELKAKGPDFLLLRKLQQYSVSLKKWDFEELIKDRRIVSYSDIHIVEDGESYDPTAGLMLENHWLEELLLVGQME